MFATPKPYNEESRLENLLEKQILDTTPEKAFDAITDSASQQFEVPITLISMIDADRMWIKSDHGLYLSEIPRENAFCAHVILHNEVMVVPDATRDPRFASNPLVTGEPFIRFYAGAPLTTSEGFNIGVLCLIDTSPRDLTEVEKVKLRRLARVVVTRLELRSATLKLQDLNISLRPRA